MARGAAPGGAPDHDAAGEAEAVSEVGLDKRELDTPVLWVDLGGLARNIGHVAETLKAAGVHWRPHVKGIKVPAIAHQALASGALGVTCAKLGEAEVMAAAGISEILVANQVVGPRKINRLVDLRRQADVKVAVDNAANVAALGRAAAARGVALGVVVEVDIGMRRAGVAPGQEALVLSRTVHSTAGLRFEGLMGWEGHARAEADLDRRRPIIEEAIGLLVESAALVRCDGLPVKIVSAGGTGTYYVTALQPGVTEIQAGGAIFGDIASRDWGVDTAPCLFVRTTVTSRPAPDRIIVDAGFKALPMWHNTPEVVGLKGVQSLRMSAEHGTVTLRDPSPQVAVGDAFDFVVGYGDETVCLHDRLYGIRGSTVEVVWAIEGRGKMC
jgi:D-serine deaminase-like pyridoxal phosphate-dependent protein